MTTFNKPARLASVALALSLTLAGSAARALEPQAAPEKRADFSPAERALFMSDQLSALKSPKTLSYRYRKAGSLEPGFDDTVKINVRKQADGQCCVASGEFLSGERRLAMPDAEDAKGNPVILFFLERDIREMQRLTKGQPNHFRKQIRMAIFEGAAVRDVSLAYNGKAVAGREFVISPYLNDPNRPRFESLATKQYTFTLSDAVPGGVYSIRAQVAGSAAAGAPLLLEELHVAGADARPAP
jgi:hypothetical protein